MTTNKVPNSMLVAPGAFTGGTLASALNNAPPVTLASAASVAIGAAAANTVNITGTTSITSFDTIAAGAQRELIFAGILTLTYNATSLIIPGSANVTTAAGDVAMLESLGSGNWKVVDYTRANGTALIGSGTFLGGTLTSAINNAPPVTIASAATVNIGAAAGNTINVTGTVTITAFDTIAAGAQRRTIFAGILTLTHNATSLILPGAANITTAAGDVAEWESLGGGNWKCTDYVRASGVPLVGALLTANNLSELTATAATARANIAAAPSSGIALSALATQAATSVVGNPTGSSAAPQAISYSSLAAGLATFLGLSGASLSSFALTSGNNEGILPSSIGATTWATFGTGAPTVIGTATVQTFNTTSIQLREAAYNYATLTATAGLKSGVQGLNKIYLPSSTVAGPDVKVDIKALVTDATASCRGFMGLGAGSAPNIDAGDPSGRNNMIGLWHDAADTVWQLGVTTSGGVATKVATTIPVSTLNHKLWVRIRVKGFPTNTYYIEVWDNDVFQQSATFTYAQGGTIQAVAAYAYRANAANAVITAVSVYGMAASSFSTVGDSGSPFTVIPYSTAPTINYANGANYDLTLTASTIASWTESGLTDGLSWNMVIRQDATGGRTVPAWPTSWLFENAGSVPPVVPVTATTGHTLLSGVYHAGLAKTLVSFVQAS